MTVVMYGPAWLIFTGIRPAYRQLMFFGMQIPFVLTGARLSFSDLSEGFQLASKVRPLLQAVLDPTSIITNVAFLMALILATPGWGLKKRAVSLGIGLFLLWISHLLFLIVKIQLTLANAHHPSAWGRLPFWNSLDYFFEMIGRGLFPAAIWLLLALPGFLGYEAPVAATSAGSGPPGRNSPCPCGSGKKFKHCCARR